VLEAEPKYKVWSLLVNVAVDLIGKGMALDATGPTELKLWETLTVLT